VSRRALYRTAGLSGVNHVARALLRGRLLVVCYHGVCGPVADVPDVDGIHVPLPLFEAQIRFVLRHYRPVSLAEVRAHLLFGAPLPHTPILITFDDGYRNVMRNALPLLRSLGVPSVVFPVAGVVESGGWLWNSWVEWRFAREPEFARLRAQLKALGKEERESWLQEQREVQAELPECDYSLLGWNELASLLAAGEVELGSHGLTHHSLATCAPRDLDAELRESRRLIAERLRVTVDTVAYPNGDAGPAVSNAARECGYRLGFTTAPYHARRQADPLTLPRILIGRDDVPAVLAARLSGWLEVLASFR